MGRALIVSAGASSNEYISARLTELGYARPIIVPSAAEARRTSSATSCAPTPWRKRMPV